MIRFTKRVTIFTILLYGIAFAQNTAPVVTNVDFTMRNDGSKVVDITYDVFDAQGQTMTVTIAASSDGGVTWNLPITQVTGAVGSGITNGTGKIIVWNAGAEIPNFYSATVQLRITADDGVVPIPTCPGIPTVTYAGKTYNTVQIGNQCWLRENLDVGTMIPGSQDQSNNSVIEKYCYDDNTTNCNSYGGLYQWNEAMQYVTTPGTKGICPTGWHIPTNAELHTLASVVGNDGNALKEIGQGSGGGEGTNTSGFSALLVGSRTDGGVFVSLSYYAYFWSSTEIYGVNAKYFGLYYSDNNIDLQYNYTQAGGFSIRCLRGEVILPVINTSAVSNIGVTTATGGGEVTSAGSSPVTERGVCWSTSENPTIADSKTSDGSGLGVFTSSITGLTANTTYYVRAYTTNSVGTIYGNQVSFTTLSGVFTCGTSIVSYGGKIYNTVQIGSQCWLKQNLDLGTMIQGNQSATNNSVIEKYCYNNNVANCNTYGGLYQWHEAMQYVNTQGARGICPTGWHIPIFSELETLASAVGNNGNALKEVGQGTGGGAGTNTSGFSALLAGNYNINGGFYDIGISAHFWSSTENVSTTGAVVLNLYSNDSVIYLIFQNKGQGFSVRCIQD